MCWKNNYCYTEFLCFLVYFTEDWNEQSQNSRVDDTKACWLFNSEKIIDIVTLFKKHTCLNQGQTEEVKEKELRDKILGGGRENRREEK